MSRVKIQISNLIGLIAVYAEFAVYKLPRLFAKSDDIMLRGLRLR